MPSISTNGTKLNISNSIEEISISEANGSKPFGDKEIAHFFDRILANFQEDCTIKGTPAYAKGQDLINILRSQNVTEEEFKAMLKGFISNYEYPTWKPANVLKYLEQPKLHNESWYKHQLQTTEYNPEDFECYLLNGEKMYCYKHLTKKVRYTKHLQPFRLKQVTKALPKADEREWSSEAKLLNQLTLENNELRRKQQIYKNQIEDLRNDITKLSAKIVKSDKYEQKQP